MLLFYIKYLFSKETWIKYKSNIKAKLKEVQTLYIISGVIPSNKKYMIINISV